MKLTISVVLVCLFLLGCENFSNLIHIENNSEIQFAEVTISVCDSLWVIQNMDPEEKHDFTASYSTDGSFLITAVTASNDSISGNFGYVTHSMTGDRVWISIEDDSIAFRQNSSNSY